MMMRAEAGFQAVVGAPGFCLGVRCNEREILALEFLAPCSEQAPENALAAEAGRQLLAYLADPAFHFSLPLALIGTDFQRRVRAQIAAIPCGQTKTYGELAKALGSSPRAVGQACGANPFPVVVPCHRVVASGGGLGGFVRQRGGFLLDVKRWLLAHERR
ncbi:methylated-DNA--[protein]-cysteine S-methyltransferase [Propionivibrio limicola]|uniref:methylated-DNA--[protein]-cysteine S-methyltransferase n=1 Tax=Propionivibrio limicola TaxID=167645 RepID=UPI001B8757DE|nr:methylated-DNA--[protein]-cysteine S-methyltransferase [Propionivibrio limicola]